MSGREREKKNEREEVGVGKVVGVRVLVSKV